MRLATLIAAACLGLAASAHADGKEGRSLNVPPISPLEATGHPATPASYGPGHEPGIYRFGATYAVRTSASVNECEAVCADESACQAWSFVASYGASPARCELKRGGGRPEENLLATSGFSPSINARFWGAPSLPPEPSRETLEGGLADAEADELVESVSAGLMSEPAPSSP